MSQNEKQREIYEKPKHHVLSGSSVKMIKSLQEKHFGKNGKEKEIKTIKAEYENQQIQHSYNHSKNEINDIKSKAFRGLNNIFKEEIKHAQKEEMRRQINEVTVGASMVVERLQSEK